MVLNGGILKGHLRKGLSVSELHRERDKGEGVFLERGRFSGGGGIFLWLKFSDRGILGYRSFHLDMRGNAMKIRIGDGKHLVAIETTQNVLLSRVYDVVGVETRQGTFGVCEREGGLEVTLRGQIIWSSTDLDK